MDNEIAISVSSRNQANLDQYGKQAKAAGKDIEDGISKGFKGAEQAADKSSKQIGESGRRAGQEYGEKFGGAVKGAGGDALDALMENLGGPGAAGLAGAGAAIGGLLVAGINQAFQENSVGALLAAQTGATGQAAAQLGDVAGDVFADNFGESIEEVGAAMKAVFDNRLVDKSAAESDIKAVTEAAMTAAQVIGEEVNSVGRAAQQLVRTGLAGSVSEALDMITHASQDGLNASEDLLDTVTEYSTKFRDLGLSGQEAMGLVSQAVMAGARDTDTAADALKEFAIRAQDGSASTARGFASIGLQAETMGSMIAAGGQSASKALLATLDGLRAIEDPVQRDQAAVDLFGTKAEDLGDSLYSMDLKTAARDFGAFGDATAKAGEQLAKATPALETAWKNLTSGISNAVDWSTQSDAIDNAVKKAREGIEAAARPQEEYKQRVQEASDAWKNQGGAIRHVVMSLDELIDKQRQLQGGVLDLSEAQIGYQKALDDANASAAENGRTLDINTEKGRENRESLNDLAQATYDQVAAMQEQGATTQDVAAFMGTARDQFISTARSMGLSQQQAEALANSLRLIPGVYTARVVAETSQAASAIQTIHGKLVDLTNRSWIASVAVTAGGAGGGRLFAGLEHGGVVGHAAEGGARGNLTMVGEHGPELVDLAPGSTVHSNPDAQRMLSGSAPAGPTAIHMHVTGDQDSMLLTWWKKQVRDGNIRMRAGSQDVVVA